MLFLDQFYTKSNSIPLPQSVFYWNKALISPCIEHLVKVTGPQIGPVHFPRIWAVDRPYMGHSSLKQGL